MTDYYQNPAISASGLKQLLKSPAHFKAERETTDAMKFGTQTHCALLEPAEFDNRYSVVPEGLDYRSKEGKEIKAAIEASGKEPIKYAEMQDILAIQKSFHANTDVMNILQHAIFEREFYFKIGDIDAKMKTDIIIEPCDAFPNGLVADLKSCPDASPQGFARSMWNDAMYIQAAFYSIAFNRIYNTSAPPPFLWIPVERKAPYLNAVYSCPDHVLSYGWKECERLLEIYAQCLASDYWPGYPSGINELVLPAWVENAMLGDKVVLFNDDGEVIENEQ